MGRQVRLVEGAGGDHEEHPIDHHQDQDRKMQVDTLGFIVEETFSISYIWFGEDVLLIVRLVLHDLISEDDGNGQGCTGSPGNNRIDDKLENG